MFFRDVVEAQREQGVKQMAPWILQDNYDSVLELN